MYDKWRKKLKFTESQKIEFINSIKERPMIWYNDDLVHSTRDERNRLWNELVDIFCGKDFDCEERCEIIKALQGKWRDMRANYLKYLRNHEMSCGTHKFYKLFRFLNETVTQRLGTRYQLNVEEEEGSETVEEVNDDSDEVPQIGEEDVLMRNNAPLSGGNNDEEVATETPEKDFRKRCRENSDEEEEEGEIDINRKRDDHKNKDRSTTEPSQSAKKMCRQVDDSFETERNGYVDDILDMSDDSADNLEVEKSSSHSERNKLQKKQSPDEEEDECEVFGRLVSFQLQRLDSHTRSRLQGTIYQTLFNAEMGSNDL